MRVRSARSANVPCVQRGGQIVGSTVFPPLEGVVTTAFELSFLFARACSTHSYILYFAWTAV